MTPRKPQQPHVAESAASRFDFLLDLVFRFDRKLRCTYANTAVEQASGSRRDSLLQKSFVEICGRADLAGVWEVALRRVFERGVPEALEARLQFASGERVLHSVLIPEPLEADCQPQSVLVIAHDVTQPERVVRDLEELADQLRQRDRSLRELIARIALPAQAHVQGLAPDKHRDLLLHLTVHERDLLRLVAEGRSNADIGRALGLSPGTVRNQLTRLFLKLGVSDRTHAAARAVALGLVSGEA